MTALDVRPAARRGPVARWRILVPAAGLAVIALVSLVGPFFLVDPLDVGAGEPLSGPSGAHLFGVDQYGMDVLSRVVSAGRIDLLLALSASAIALVAGIPLGAFAGYRGGAWDQGLLRVAESFQAFPTMLLAMGVTLALGPSLPNLVAVIAVVNIPLYMRLARSAVIPLREADFVLAARCAGRSTFQIVRQHIVPNIAQVAIAQFSVTCAWAIQVLAGLSFIGIGVRMPTAEWGSMIRQGTDHMVTGQWWLSVFPGLAILLTVLALNQIAAAARRWGGPS
ncbi:ABC transporter permease [Phytohabitans suffuscus]|uniref:ABC transporter permease n=1 Tax=Phytohabitans suffuscus TaxID=624315 RepID=A0A6F8YUK4_9ACTN|nr:ABC transporter permease [Phytohabitans suffuscus]BCB89618.1 ABC transporter permease [Phytohabitans suffuscus]